SPPPPHLYSLSLHDALPIFAAIVLAVLIAACDQTAAPTPAPATSVPCGPGEVLTRHEHAHLTILVRGQIKTVPAFTGITASQIRSEEHTSELQSRFDLVCRL